MKHLAILGMSVGFTSLVVGTEAKLRSLAAIRAKLPSKTARTPAPARVNVYKKMPGCIVVDGILRVQLGSPIIYMASMDFIGCAGNRVRRMFLARDVRMDRSSQGDRVLPCGNAMSDASTHMLWRCDMR